MICIESVILTKGGGGGMGSVHYLGCMLPKFILVFFGGGMGGY